jgi:hypothetical protein
MPLHNRPLPEGVLKKLVKFTPIPDITFQNNLLYVYEAPVGVGPDQGNDPELSGTEIDFQNLLLTSTKTTAFLNITLVPSTHFQDGILRGVVLGQGVKPLETIMSSPNPLS